eukprot:9147771-Lingulodinium_polyedra.AAC.1
MASRSAVWVCSVSPSSATVPSSSAWNSCLKHGSQSALARRSGCDLFRGFGPHGFSQAIRRHSCQTSRQSP